MDFLVRNSKRVQGSPIADEGFISAQGRHVLVIGSGNLDSRLGGSGFIGTSNRHGAKSVTRIETLDKPPVKEDKGLTWPDWPNKLRTSSSQEEGCDRHWNVQTKAFIGDENGRVKAVTYCLVRWDKADQGCWQLREVPGTEAEFQADLVLLAMGFVHPVHQGMLNALKDEGLELDPRGNVRADPEGVGAAVPGVCSAGDMRRGQSLVVWAIRERRQCVRDVDEWLMGRSDLPR